MGPIPCPERSVTNRPTTSNNPDERRFQLHRAKAYNLVSSNVEYHRIWIVSSKHFSNSMETASVAIVYFFLFICKKVKFPLPTIWKRLGWVKLQLHWFLTSAVDGGECWTSPSRSFTSEKEIWYPFNRRQSTHHSRCGTSGEEKGFLTLLGYEPWIDRSVAFICT